MKHRSLGKMFLLFLVTLSIYRLYWFAKTMKEIMSISDVKIPSLWYLVSPIIFIVFLFIASVAAANINDTAAAILNIVVIPSFFAIFVVAAWWLWHYCKAVEVVTKEKMQFGVAMLITLLIPDGIDILIMQDSFNKIATHGHKASA